MSRIKHTIFSYVGLFVEFDCTTIESLLASINNQIDRYTKMLHDDPCNTWAQTRIESLKELGREIYKRQAFESIKPN